MSSHDTQVGPTALPSHLRVSGIHKRFGGVHALRGVDFEVGRGEVMALVGVTTPHDATALGIQIVCQDLALCENLDVAANLSLGAEPVKPGWSFLSRILRPLDELEMDVRAQKAIDRLQVRTLHSVRAKVGGLSGGQRQATAIARAVGAEGMVVMLDEPTAAQGVAQTRQVLDVLKRLRDTDHAVVYISHNMRDIVEVADRICELRHGAKVATWTKADSTPDEIVVAITRGLDDKAGHAA